MNSKEKGKKAELEVVHIIQARGYDAMRTAQVCGKSGTADVIGLDGYHIEVKRREKADIYSWIAQSESEAREGEIPIVVFRKSKDKWRVIIGFDDFLDLVEKGRLPFEDPPPLQVGGGSTFTAEGVSG